MTAPDRSKPEGAEVTPPAMRPSRLSPEEKAKCDAWRQGLMKAMVGNLNRNVLAELAGKDDPDQLERVAP